MDYKTLYNMLEKVDTKLDKLDHRLDKVDVRLAKYNTELEFHIARTNQIEDDLLPIVRHVEQIRGAAKLVAIVAGIVGLVAAIIAIL
jgi:iron uptake system EfeUOB component EfeO/EfeM